jgi:hypothetical protein
MLETLQFGFEATEKGPRLSLFVPARLAKQIEETGNIESGLAKLHRRNILAVTKSENDPSIRIGVNAKAIGRQFSHKKKAILQNVTKVLDPIMTGVHRIEADPTMRIGAFWQQADEFRFAATVQVPEIEESTLKRMVGQRMVTMAQDLQALPSSSRCTESGTSTPWVSISDAEGITLSLASGSNVYTTGAWPMEMGGERGVRLVHLEGSHVGTVAEPLIYLAGVTALAHATELT